MGCGITREKTEIEYLYTQLMKTEIQDEKRAIVQRIIELDKQNIAKLKLLNYIDDDYYEIEDNEMHRSNIRK